MATYPHEPSQLTKAEKSAYRQLLYWAMLDIRMLCQSRCAASRNPWEIWRQYKRSRLAGAVADWLHNLAQHAATDFDEFDTEWFWREYTYLKEQYPDVETVYWMEYRARYEEHLARLNAQ